MLNPAIKQLAFVLLKTSRPDLTEDELVAEIDKHVAEAATIFGTDPAPYTPVVEKGETTGEVDVSVVAAESESSTVPLEDQDDQAPQLTTDDVEEIVEDDEETTPPQDDVSNEAKIQILTERIKEFDDGNAPGLAEYIPAMREQLSELQNT